MTRSILNNASRFFSFLILTLGFPGLVRADICDDQFNICIATLKETAQVIADQISWSSGFDSSDTEARFGDLHAFIESEVEECKLEKLRCLKTEYKKLAMDMGAMFENAKPVGSEPSESECEPPSEECCPDGKCGIPGR